jgi:hypothetical protein
MPMQYTPADLDLCGAVTLRFEAGAGQRAFTIPFQFPPKIITDSRKAEWNEKSLYGTEPVATLARTGPREISLVCTYIVDGGKWNTELIARTVRRIRGYVARIRQGDDQRNLVVTFSMWLHGGGDEEPMSCRIRGVDVKHSETQVIPFAAGGGSPHQAYPLRTDITLDLRIWTKGGPAKVQDLPGLRADEPPEWY